MHQPPVLVEAPQGPVVDLEELKRRAIVDFGDDDEHLVACEKTAMEMLDGWSGILGRCLLKQKWRLDYAGWPPDPWLWLPFPNVGKATDNTEIVYYDTDNAQQIIDPSEYEIGETARGAFIRFKKTFARPPLYDDRLDALQVTFTAGYGTAADVPQPIRDAIVLTVTAWNEIRPERGADGSALPPGAVDLVQKYRRR